MFVKQTPKGFLKEALNFLVIKPEEDFQFPVWYVRSLEVIICVPTRRKKAE